MTETIDEPTILLGKIPICAVCKYSFVSKLRCAVFTCGHQFCETCNPLKSENCRVCGTGNFVMYLDESPEANAVHQRLKGNVNTYVETQDANLARAIVKDLAYLQQYIENEKKRQQEPQALPAAPEEPKQAVIEPNPSLLPPQFQKSQPPPQPARPQPEPQPAKLQSEPQPAWLQPARPQPAWLQPASPQPEPQPARPQQEPQASVGPTQKQSQSLQSRAPVTNTASAPPKTNPKNHSSQKACCSLL